MNLLFVLKEEQIIRKFGLLLKEYREASGLSQEKLAHAIESHSTHISRLENGHKQPTLTTIYKLAQALNINPEIFIREINHLLADIRQQ